MDEQANGKSQFCSSDDQSESLEQGDIFLQSESSGCKSSSSSSSHSSNQRKKEKVSFRCARNRHARRKRPYSKNKGEEKLQKMGKQFEKEDLFNLNQPPNPNCHFNIELSREKAFCKLCDEAIKFDSMGSAKMNNHMLSHHHKDFRNRSLFSEQTPNSDNFLLLKFYKVQTKRSFVWRYFIFNSEINFVICVMCWMTYNVKDGSTSGMLKHLEKYHEAIYVQKKKQEEIQYEEAQKAKSMKQRVKKEIGSKVIQKKDKIRDKGTQTLVSQNDCSGRLRFQINCDFLTEMGYI